MAVLLASPLILRRTARAGRDPNPEARELYLEGRCYWEKRTPEDLNRAVDYFTRAVVKDPRYAQAYVGLADTYNLLSEYTVMPYQKAFRRALDAAGRAVSLDDQLAEAHNSLAYAAFYGDWDAFTAEREFRRALELDPGYSTAHHWYATFLVSLGRTREALAEITRAQELEPSSRSILADKGLILLWAGENAAARTLLEQVKASEPAFASPHKYLAAIDLLEHRYADYLAESRALGLVAHDDETLTIAAAGEKGLEHGPAAMFARMLDAARRLPAGESTRYLWLAQMSAAAGDTGAAIRYLHLAFERHDVSMATLLGDPYFAGLRTLPAFQQIVAKVGLMRRATKPTT